MNRFFSLLLFTPLLATSSWADEYVQDFEKAELGYPPDELMVIDGEFEVIEHEGGKYAACSATDSVIAGSGRGLVSGPPKRLDAQTGVPRLRPPDRHDREAVPH